MNLHDFHFLRPWWLAALIPGLILLGLHRRRISGSWQKVGDPRLIGALLTGDEPGRRKGLLAAQIALLLLVVSALAGPAWEKRPQPLLRTGGGRVLVFDLSLSMRCQDLKPSRLERARFLATDIIRAGADREQGLVVFAGDAFVVAPLTDDQATLLNLLPSLDCETPPVQGSRADRGLEEAGKLLSRAGISRGQVILISDDAGPASEKKAAELAEKGHHLDVIAIGSDSGAPVPLAEGGYLKDRAGNVIIPKPDFNALKQCAESGRGSYLMYNAGEAAIRRLSEPAGMAAAQKENHEDAWRGDQWQDRGPWLLLAAILPAALCFRRGWLLLIILALGQYPLTAKAGNIWDNLWRTPAQQAARAWQQDNFPRAAEETKAPRWQALALYRQGEYEKAAEILSTLPTAEDAYNRGNALARGQRFEEALEAYDKALEKNPELNDAAANRDLIKRLLEQQQQQNQNQQDQKQEQNQQENQNDGQQEGQSQEQQTNHQQPSDEGNSKEKSSPASPADNKDSDASQAEPENSWEKPGQDKEQPAYQAKPAPGEPAEQKQPSESAAQADTDETAADESPKATAGPQENQPRDPEEQALEQWLRRVPDDPGGLLQRKFYYQYQQRGQRSQGYKGW